MPHQEPRIPAWIHFGTGLILVSVGAVISSYAHHTSVGRHMEMVNLDAWLRAGKTVVDQHIMVVQITDADYASKTFNRACPLPVAGVSKPLADDPCAENGGTAAARSARRHPGAAVFRRGPAFRHDGNREAERR